MSIIEERAERTKWFLNDRFGMFIHWGLYAIPAKGEWLRSFGRVSNEDYQKYVGQFDPVDYNPKEWAKLAKEAGMKYVVMTAKHHDGFCLFDSKLTDYKATNTKAGRDLVREYVDAFRAEGIKVGIYYSIIDWHHDDFPAYGDRQHPMRDNENYKDKKIDFSKYLEYMHGQVRELLTNYGKIDLMWFDFSYNDMTGEKWEATKLVNMMRGLQPHIIIDNRLGGNIKSKNPEIYSGDFASPEQIIPPHGVTDENGDSLPWEACITLNNNWGYTHDDENYKSVADVIRALVECVSKNGNMLLNVGPDARGNIPEQSVDILKGVAKWMSKNSESIYGCGNANLEKPEWGRYTRCDNKLYAHIMQRGVGPVNLNGLANKAEVAHFLASGSEINISTPWNAEEYPNDLFLNIVSNRLPDEADTVVEIELI